MNLNVLLIKTWTLFPMMYLKLRDKEDVIKTILLYLCLLEGKAELDQLKDGLQYLGIGQLLSKFSDTMKPLFSFIRSALNIQEVCKSQCIGYSILKLFMS